MSTKLAVKKKDFPSHPGITKALSLRTPVVVTKIDKCSTPRLKPKVIEVNKP